MCVCVYCTNCKNQMQIKCLKKIVVVGLGRLDFCVSGGVGRSNFYSPGKRHGSGGLGGKSMDGGGGKWGGVGGGEGGR